MLLCFFCFKQKTAYEMRISCWSSDVCSSDLHSIAVVSYSCVDYVTVFAGALRAGHAVAPLPPSATPEQIAVMAQDSDAGHLFWDAPNAAALADVADRLPARHIRFDTPEFDAWLAPEGARPAPAPVTPEMPFNIIYSSGRSEEHTSELQSLMRN